MAVWLPVGVMTMVVGSSARAIAVTPSKRITGNFMDRFLQGARRAVGEDAALLSRAGFRAGLRTSNSGDTRRLPVTGGVLSGLSLVTVAGAVPELHRLPDYPDVSLWRVWHPEGA